MAETQPPQSTHNSGEPREEKSNSSTSPAAAMPLPKGVPEIARPAWELVGPFLLDLVAFARWCGRNPASALALAGIAAVLCYFYGAVHPFMYGRQSTAIWAWRAWNPEGNQAYGALVPLISLWLFYYHRTELKTSAPGGYGPGLVVVGFGALLFVLAMRCQNPRMALASIPFLLYGGVRFGWGRAAARKLFFPCVFLFFMIPVGALEQATSNLQFIITGMVGWLSHLLGISILAVGTTLTATDGAFNFEIAEGCSGIRSLTAMIMLTAVFVHLTQDRLWKKLLIFSCSLVFAIIGNIGRIFSIVLLAKFYDPKVAAGVYHEYSGFVFFPIAILAMIFFSQIVNSSFFNRRSAGKEEPTVSEPR